jgi:hypothetical protein
MPALGGTIPAFCCVKNKEALLPYSQVYFRMFTALVHTEVLLLYMMRKNVVAWSNGNPHGTGTQTVPHQGW